MQSRVGFFLQRLRRGRLPWDAGLFPPMWMLEYSTRIGAVLDREDHLAVAERLLRLLDHRHNNRVYLTGQCTESLERRHVERSHGHRADEGNGFGSVEIEKDGLRLRRVLGKERGTAPTK